LTRAADAAFDLASRIARARFDRHPGIGRFIEADVTPLAKRRPDRVHWYAMDDDRAAT
jgi:hypothetical protein